ncbi:MAG: response regulator transcription factor [Mariprofundus sp.]|nr:response regulator transcription factor [Mariprofundus sp.]
MAYAVAVKKLSYAVMIVEDDPDIRKRLEQVVNTHDTLSLFAAVGCLEDGVAALEYRMPDVLLIDLGLPDGSGIDLIRMARSAHKPPECMVITIHADQHHLMQALEAGATGYLLKDALPEDISRTIIELTHGGSPISPLIARALLKRFDSGAGASGLVETLTGREVDVLKAMARGMTRKEIACKLSVSVHTIHSHVKHIYGKLQVNSNIGAVQKARRMRIISESDS